MTNPSNKVEQKLVSVLTEQKQIYLEVIPDALEVQQKMEAGGFPQDDFEKMNQKLNRIRELDQSILSERTQIEASQLQPGSVLPDLKRELTALVENLLEVTTSLEQKIAAAKQQLKPNLSSHLMASKMNRAYSKSRG
ncbi:MAG: hypothetical protein VX768_06710 [Planctomycetota bacterium]|nr:hypothetical protein [Planctomycetota bacterium]